MNWNPVCMHRLCALLLFAVLLSGCTAAGWQFAAAPETVSSSQSALSGGMEDAAIAGASAASSETLPPESGELPSPETSIPPDSAAGLQDTPLASPAHTPTPRPTGTPAPYVQGSQYFSPGTNPLTGLKLADPSLLERRPIVVKVTNFPRGVRPQWGLSRADHVYEYYIGDSMSRFIGVFYGQDAEQVGPIRSARLFDEHVMRAYQGIFVFGWADDPVLEPLLTPDLKNHLVVEHGDNCPPLCRIGPSRAYNNLYTDTGSIAAYLEGRGTDNRRPALRGLRFEQETPRSGSPGSMFSIQYSMVSYHYWQYAADTGRYLRFQETEDRKDGQTNYAPLTDSLTGEQLSADNVLVLLLPHTYFLKSSSTTILDQVFTGEGHGYAFRDGQIYPILWSHPDPNSLPAFFLPNGRAYPLKPGNVWFEILSDETTFSPAESSGWSFDFSLPEPPATETPTPTPTGVKAGSRSP